MIFDDRFGRVPMSYCSACFFTGKRINVSWAIGFDRRCNLHKRCRSIEAAILELFFLVVVYLDACLFEICLLALLAGSQFWWLFAIFRQYAYQAWWWIWAADLTVSSCGVLPCRRTMFSLQINFLVCHYSSQLMKCSLRPRLPPHSQVSGCLKCSCHTWVPFKASLPF